MKKRGKPKHAIRSGNRKSRVTFLVPKACHEIAGLLARGGKRLILAESCTSGLIAALLGTVPGISDHFCGSAVTYRDATKEAWLGIPKEALKKPGAVSSLVARLMAENALAITPEAHVAASVTGHLGPNAPADLDGIIYIGISQRAGESPVTRVTKVQLTARSRSARQREAAVKVLAAVKSSLVM